MKKIIAVMLFLTFILSTNSVFALTKEEAASLDLTEKSGLSAEELSLGLSGEILNLAPDFIAAEEKYGVNAIFLCAVAALESGWGKYCFRENNIFGWSGKDFSSKSECVDFVASRIAMHYLSEDGKYYHGKTVSRVNICYNGSDFWENKIAGIMAMISRRISNVERG